MRVAVSGACGRMGALIIQNIMESSDMELVAAFDVVKIGSEVEGVGVSDPQDMQEVLEEASPDVLIDFTLADSAFENVKKAASKGVNLIVGTTGFSEEQIDEMNKAIEGNVAAVISPNFSIGVNVFWKMIEDAKSYLKDYDIEIIEAHHRHKKDAPSGTALHAARILGDKFVYGREGVSPRGDEIGIHSVRGGDIVGDHTVLFAGEGERFEITHRAHSRQSFATGAIKAARWVVSAGNGVHSMSEVLGF